MEFKSDGAGENRGVIGYAPRKELLPDVVRGIAGQQFREALHLQIAPDEFGRTLDEVLALDHPAKHIFSQVVEHAHLGISGQPGGGAGDRRDRSSLGTMPDSISAAFELSSKAPGGMRSLKGWRMSGGNSQTPVSVATDEDIWLPMFISAAWVESLRACPKPERIIGRRKRLPHQNTNATRRRRRPPVVPSAPVALLPP